MKSLSDFSSVAGENEGGNSSAKRNEKHGLYIPCVILYEYVSLERSGEARNEARPS